MHVAWIGTLALGAWAWLAAGPYAIAILAACPWIALYAVARSGGHLTIYDRRHRRYPVSIGVAFVFPGLILMVDSVRSIKLLSWESAMAISACVAAALWFAALKIDPVVRLKVGYTVGAFLLCAPYGYGLATEANARLDHSPVATYSTRVTGKHVSHGRRSTSYDLNLEPWGPHLHGDRVSVSSALYRSTLVGNDICVDVRRGALRIEWYVVRRCQ